MKEITFKQFKKELLYHRIVKWDKNTIVLDNGITIDIEETEQDCCASASGEFTNVTLEAVITYVSEPKYEAWEDGDTYGCEAVVKFLHNQNLICQAEANADAGNGGYYFSIASFVITKNNKQMKCHFVRSDDD